MIKFLLVLISFSIFAQEGTVEEKELNVAIGIDEIIKLDYKYNTKIQVGDESKISLILAPSRQEITFRGVRAGKTSVTIRDASGDVRTKYIVNITSDGKSNIVRELRELLGDIEGLEITIKGGKVILEGEIVVPSDLGRIGTVLGAYSEVIPMIEMSPQTQRIIARKMQEEINKNGMKDVSVRIINGDYWLEGVVKSAGNKELAESIANAYLPDKVQSLASSSGGSRFQGKERGVLSNFISVNEKKDPPPPPKLIKVTSQFVELTKDYQRVFAFQWAPLMSNAGQIEIGKSGSGEVTANETGTLAGTISNLFPKLNSAKSAGYARIIQSGMIITEENQAANLTKNKKIPYAVGSGDTQQASSVDLKFSMSVTPSIADKESVKLASLVINVSLPDGETKGGQPTVTSNTLSTNIVVKSKESAVIGGVVQNTSNTSYDKNLPTGGISGASGGEAGEASILFNLLRSKGYVTSKAQFVVFVTPEIIASASQGTQEIRKKFRKRQR